MSCLRMIFLVRILFLFALIFLKINILHAQKRTEALIPDEEKRKVVRAKKLFNEFKIYQGEQILKELIRQHPYEYYYHEALVQLQRQVLDQLRPAHEEYEAIKPTLSSDSTLTEEESDELAIHENRNLNQPVAKKDTVAEEWNGLDTGPRKVDKVKKKIVEVENEDGPILTEATVTIDSSLLRDDTFQNDEGEVVKKGPKKDKSLERKLKALTELAQIPYDSYKNDLIQNCRKATLQVPFVDSASYYLRYFLIDTLDPDVRASDAAKDAYESGLEELKQHEPLNAIKLFKEAIALNADYYQAHLYLGDAWKELGKDTNAIREYVKASLLQPDRPEPLEKLSNLYYENGKFKDAAAACIDAIIIYPHQYYFSLLKRIVNKTGNDFDTQWLLREVYPLTTSKNYFEITAKEKTPWWIYQEAEGDVHSYFDTTGIVRPNDKTSERYLEMYAWKRVLANTKRDYLPFARAMAKMGYLECYLFVTCFHHDLYGQFRDYAKKNPEKIKEYFFILINWNTRKFEKIRKEFYPKEENKTDKKTEEK